MLVVYLSAWALLLVPPFVAGGVWQSGGLAVVLQAVRAVDLDPSTALPLEVDAYALAEQVVVVFLDPRASDLVLAT